MMDAELKKIFKWEVLGALVIVLLFLIFDFFPKLKKASELNTKIKRSKSVVQGLSVTETQWQQRQLEEKELLLGDFLNLIPRVTSAVQDKVIQDKNIPLVTMEIEDLADSSDIKLTLIRPLEIEMSENYEILPIEIQFKCGYEKLIKFLSDVEKSPKLMSIRNLSIKRDKIIYPDLDVRLKLSALFAFSRAKILEESAKKEAQKKNTK